MSAQRRDWDSWLLLLLVAAALACDGSSVGDDSGDGGTELAAGSVVISEFLTSPFDNADDLTTQQWVELHNPGGAAVDLRGCGIGSGGVFSGVSVVEDSLVIPSGGYILVGASTDPAENNDVAVAWSWSPFPGLPTQDGTFTVFTPDGNVIDEVVYSNPEWPYEGAGYSFSLDPGSLEHVANDDGANWCAASTFVPSTPMWSPGSENPACP